MREDGVHQAPADALALAVGQHAVGRQEPELLAILRDRETDDLVGLDGDPAAVGIHGEEIAHPVDPLCGGGLRARPHLRVADPPAAPIGLEERHPPTRVPSPRGRPVASA
jgi:hypothetical protein